MLFEAFNASACFENIQRPSRAQHPGRGVSSTLLDYSMTGKGIAIETIVRQSEEGNSVNQFPPYKGGSRLCAAGLLKDTARITPIKCLIRAVEPVHGTGSITSKPFRVYIRSRENDFTVPLRSALEKQTLIRWQGQAVFSWNQVDGWLEGSTCAVCYLFVEQTFRVFSSSFLRPAKEPYPCIKEPGEQSESCQSKHEDRRATAAAPSGPGQGWALHPACPAKDAAQIAPSHSAPPEGM